MDAYYRNDFLLVPPSGTTTGKMTSLRGDLLAPGVVPAPQILRALQTIQPVQGHVDEQAEPDQMQGKQATRLS